MAAHPRFGDGRRMDLSSGPEPSRGAEYALFAGTFRGPRRGRSELDLQRRHAEPDRPQYAPPLRAELVPHADLAQRELLAADALARVADEVPNAVLDAPAVLADGSAEVRDLQRTLAHAAELIGGREQARLELLARLDGIAGEVVDPLGRRERLRLLRLHARLQRRQAQRRWPQEGQHGGPELVAHQHAPLLEAGEALDPVAREVRAAVAPRLLVLARGVAEGQRPQHARLALPELVAQLHRARLERLDRLHRVAAEVLQPRLRRQDPVPGERPLLHPQALAAGNRQAGAEAVVQAGHRDRRRHAAGAPGHVRGGERQVLVQLRVEGQRADVEHLGLAVGQARP